MPARALSHHASAATDLGVCARRVGLADRPDLQTLELTGPRPALARLIRAHSGEELIAGLARRHAGTWWSAAAPGRILLLDDAARIRRLHALLGGYAQRIPGVELRDSADRWRTVALVGRMTDVALRRLGVPGAAALAPSTGAGARVAGADVHVLLEAPHVALVVAEAGSAAAVRQAVRAAGAPLGLSVVGLDAAKRYGLIRPRAGAAVA